MPTPEKKTRSQRVQEAYEGSAQAVEQAAAANAAAVQGANDQYNQDMAAANDALMQSRQAGRTALQQSLDEGMSAYDAIFQEADKRLKTEEQEGQDQIKADQNAAAITGYAELAASLANLIGVGAHNAVSQTYHSYSQDWMKKADADRRAHQTRMDNLRERQRAIQQHMLQLKMNNAGQLLNYDNETAGLAYKGAAERAKGNLNTAVTIASINAQGAQGAAAQRTQGAVAGVNTEIHEQQLADAAAARKATLEQNYQLHGFTKDPKTGRWAAPAGGVSSSSSSSGSGSGSILRMSFPTGDGKGLRLNIRSGSLLATMNANIDLFNESDQKAIDRIMKGDGSQDDKAKKMQQYIKNSPDMVSLLRLSSESADEFDWKGGNQGASATPSADPNAVGDASGFDALFNGWANNNTD